MSPFNARDFSVIQGETYNVDNCRSNPCVLKEIWSKILNEIQSSSKSGDFFWILTTQNEF